MMTDDNNNCILRCSNSVVQFLENGFYKFGRTVGSHPWITICLSVIVAMCCAVGMLKFSQETRSEKLWVPIGSVSIGHEQLVNDWFPTTSRFENVLVEADNVLKPATLRSIMALHEDVIGITVANDNWESLCIRRGPTCFTTSVLELWSFNSTIINSLDQDAILDKINTPNLISPVYFSPVDVENWFGEIIKDGNGRITGAKATALTWYIIDQGVFDNSQGADVDVVGEAWEGSFSNIMKENSTTDFTLYHFNKKSFSDESSATISGDLSLLSAGYMLIIVYVIYAMSKLTLVEHKDGDKANNLGTVVLTDFSKAFDLVNHMVYVSFAGILTVGMAIVSAMGLASAFGQLYGPVHSVLPFLLLGIGVDDMFVLMTSWYNLTEAEKKLDVKEQVGRALKHSGVSITVTSITDFCAFLIGATTILPALRSFCIYCGIGIIFLFLFSVTFFLSWLVIDRWRFNKRLDACCCCFRHNDEYTPMACGERNFLQEFFYKFYSPFVLSLPVKVIRFHPVAELKNAVLQTIYGQLKFRRNFRIKGYINLSAIGIYMEHQIIVILITIGVLGVCIWGTVTWKQNFDFRWFLPADGSLRAFFDANDKYFPAKGFNTAIYLDTVDYYDERQKIDGLYSKLKSNKWIQSSSCSSWYDSYHGWLSATKVNNPGLNSDNWPRNETLFFNWLDEFLVSSQGSQFRQDIIFSTDASSDDKIIASRIKAAHILFRTSIEEVSGMDSVRGLARNAEFAAGKDSAFAFSEVYLNYESNKVIQNELLRNLGLASVCVFIVIFILLANLLQCILVFSCVIFTLVDLAGSLNFWGITIDTVVSVQLILAIGLAVDYSVHIGHTFMIFSGTRNDRTRATLGCMGAAVFNGGFSTFLAFVLLAGSNSYIFTTFFKIFFLVVLYGLFHGLVFLPVILSLVGPSPYLSAKPADTDVVESQPSIKVSSPEATETAVADTRNEKRITPMYNPAFIKGDETEMNKVSHPVTNGSVSHNEKAEPLC